MMKIKDKTMMMVMKAGGDESKEENHGYEGGEE
jgi:hypothetical protein